MTTGSKNPLIVLIHGYLDDETLWQEVAGALEARGYATVAPRFAREGELTLDAFAETVAAAAAESAGEAGTDGVVYVGHSMGAQLAELAAGKAAAVLKGLVLLSPVPLGGLPLPAEVSGPLRGCGGNTDIHRTVRTQLSSGLGAPMIERLVEIGAAIPPARIEGWFDAWSTGDAAAAAVAPPEVPTLILTAGDDPFVNDQVLGLVVGRFPRAEVRKFAVAGHWPHLQAPDAVATEIEQFLRSLADGTAGADGDVTEEAWTTAFSEQRDDSFAATLAPEVSLHASVIRKPLSGRDTVAYALGQASQMYDELTFVHQAETGRLTFLEWRAHTTSGISVEGVTVLERDEEGLIARVAIHHRPLDGVLAFSTELGTRTAGVLGEGHFWKPPAEA